MTADKAEPRGEVRISIKLDRGLREAMQRTARSQERSMAGWARTVLRSATAAAARAGKLGAAQAGEG